MAGLKKHLKKLHGSVDQNTYWIFSLFQAKYKLVVGSGFIGGGGGEGVNYHGMYFCLQVDGPIVKGVYFFISGEMGLISRSLLFAILHSF